MFCDYDRFFLLYDLDYVMDLGRKTVVQHKNHGLGTTFHINFLINIKIIIGNKRKYIFILPLIKY